MGRLIQQKKLHDFIDQFIARERMGYKKLRFLKMMQKETKIGS